MPLFRKITPGEVEQRRAKSSSPAKRIAEEYDALLTDFAPGESAEIVLQTDENPLTIRKRVQAAAARKGWVAHFLQKQRGEAVLIVEFVAQPAQDQAATTTIINPRRPGRPRKQ